MSDRYAIAEEDDFDGDGSRVITEVEGREIAVFRHDGDYYALANYCIHQAGPLCEGPLSGNITTDDEGWDWEYDDEERYIVCPWHGWMFDIETGRSPKDERYGVPTYDVEVEDGTVYAVG
ncbi:Rieske (2Fe-2S) protein [Halobellus marinus]|jgi:nitrite reductase/ring-hydroxylating ferredoxin subunit|uniref:Rieske (2Fe-2S) protein n=1 Tax=Halobellus TaxID=1073986 RepID=UPI0028ACB9B6|nr:Rieske (2Fe-2S) protein [Halobellus sp. DFY28]